MWKFRDLPVHERRICPTLTSFSVFSFLPLLQLLKCLSEYLCGHNLTMKFPSDFHNCTGLNGLVNSFFVNTIAPPNKMILGCKPHWSAKREGNNIMWEVAARRRSEKKLSWKFLKFTEKYLCGNLFLTLLKAFRPSVLQLY